MTLLREQYRFFDTSGLKDSQDIEKRANVNYIQAELEKRFPREIFERIDIQLNRSGIHKLKGSKILKVLGLIKDAKDLPSYYEVRIRHKTGQSSEEIIVWSPVAWNDRFAGTAGGGTSTGGEGYLTKPDNTSRGWSVPYALMNGFTAATADACNMSGIKDLMLDEHGLMDKDLYENWRLRTTHSMTIYGKAVAEILHDRSVRYAYLNGGSGGGRQSMMSVQNYPGDYDGVWAVCPAIHWTKFVLSGLWYIAVMNDYKHILSHKKIRYFTEKVWESVGGREAYYKLEQPVVFDTYSLVGDKVKGGRITEKDALIMEKLWDGPRDEDGTLLWYGMRPGVVFWNVGIPVGSFYYSLLRKKPKPFVITENYAKWVTGNPKEKFDRITIKEFIDVFKKSVVKFRDAAGDMADLTSFTKGGGKLIIDHGLNDPLIPVDGTIDYYQSMLDIMGKEAVDDFCRLYLTPGDGHGNCWSDGPGLLASSGLEALMEWVEKGKKPDALRAVKVNKKNGQLIHESMRKPVKDIAYWRGEIENEG